MHDNSSANTDTNQNYSYHIGELIVPSASCLTDLGVSYDDKLSAQIQTPYSSNGGQNLIARQANS